MSSLSRRRQVRRLAPPWRVLESDPGLFSLLLQRLGVQNAKVVDATLNGEVATAGTVFGLVLLLPWRSALDDAEDDEDDETLAPKLFFAKQVVENNCATQALLSVVLNHPNIARGEQLTEWHSTVQSATPAQKGAALGACDAMRRIHNGFAPPDPFPSAFSASSTRPNAGRGSPRSRGSASVGSLAPDPLFHFVAYIPVDGAVYEMDGMRSAPRRVCHPDEAKEAADQRAGTDGDDAGTKDWLSVARPAIKRRMQRYADSELRFNLLAIVETDVAIAATQVPRLRVVEQQCVQRLAELKLGGARAEGAEPAPAASAVVDEDTEELLARTSTSIEMHARRIVAEEMAYEKWEEESTYRCHNFVPFIASFCHSLKRFHESAFKRDLQTLLDAQRSGTKRMRATRHS